MCARLLATTAAVAVLAAVPAHAQNTWLGANPGDTSFNTPGNWTPASVPTGAAFFGPATVTDPNIFSPAINTLNQFEFLSGTPSYSIGVFGTLNLNSGGVTVNDSGRPENIIVLSAGTLNLDHSTAGDNTIFYGNRGGAINFNLLGSTAGSANFENQTGGGTTGTITFNDGASAGSSLIRNDFGAGNVIFHGASTASGATILNESATGGGNIIFTDTSKAGSATIQNLTAGNNITFLLSSDAGNASILNSTGSNLNFQYNSTADKSTIINNGTTTFANSATAGEANITNSATLFFIGTSTGGAATITTTSGGATSFYNSSNGQMARFITDAGGAFDISSLTSGGMTAGSIEGAGNYFLGSKELTTGLNDLSTTVSGVIADGGAGGGAGGSLIKVGAGTLTLSGPNTYSGATEVNGGILQAGATNTFSPNSAVRVAGGSTLDLNGFNQTLNNGLTNAGTVQLPAFPGVSAPGTILTVNNYVGNNGALVLNTFLGADNSPSDKLVINGGAADPSVMHIFNVGGPGAETTANGILVVQAINGGMTEPGAFALAGEVSGGPFDYYLFRGGINGADPQDWFLRSSFIVPGPGPLPEVPTSPELPTDPPPEPLPPGVYPIIGPRLATYGVIQPIARQMGLATLGTQHERIGDSYEPDCGVAAATASDQLPTEKPGPASYPFCGPSAWARVFGQQIDNHYRAFADPSAHGSLGGFQGGVDLWRGSLIAGQFDRAGIYFGFGASTMNVDGLVTNPAATAYIMTQTGKLNLDAYSGGAYWTHVGPGGWYLDAVVQGSVYSDNASTAFSHLSATNGTGFLASLEAGYPIALPLWQRFVLEPQAQILWQHVGFGQAYDGVSRVALGSTNGPTGRLGLLAESTFVTDGGQMWKPYVGANLWESWGARAATTFGGSSVRVPLLEQASWLEFAGGGTVKVNPNWSFFGQAGYQFAVAPGNIRRNGFAGDFGLRYTW
jgi:outer membrane autotransporter protein